MFSMEQAPERQQSSMQTARPAGICVPFAVTSEGQKGLETWHSLLHKVEHLEVQETESFEISSFLVTAITSESI